MLDSHWCISEHVGYDVRHICLGKGRARVVGAHTIDGTAWASLDERELEHFSQRLMATRQSLARRSDGSGPFADC